MSLFKSLANVAIIAISAGPVFVGSVIYAVVLLLTKPNLNEYEIASKAGKKMRDIFDLIRFK